MGDRIFKKSAVLNQGRDIVVVLLVVVVIVFGSKIKVKAITGIKVIIIMKVMERIWKRVIMRKITIVLTRKGKSSNVCWNRRK